MTDTSKLAQTINTPDISPSPSQPQPNRLSKAVPLFIVSVLTFYFFMIFLTNIDVGFIGDGVRYYLSLFLGNAVSLLPFCGLYWLLERYIIPVKYHNAEHSVGFSILGFIIFILSSSSVFHLIDMSQNNGGFWGLWTAKGLLSGLGFWGTALICVFFIIFSLSLFISVHWRLLFIATGMRILSIKHHPIKEIALEYNGTEEEKQLEDRPPETKSFLIHKKSDNTAPTTLTQEGELPKKEALSFLSQQMKSLGGVFKREKTQDDPIKTFDDFILADKEEAVEFFPPEEAVLPKTMIEDSLDNQFSLDETVEDADEDEKITQPKHSFSTSNTTEPKKHHIEKTTINPAGTVKKKIFSNVLKTDQLPPLQLLDSNIIKVNSYTDEQLNEMGEALEKNLKHFNIEVAVKAIQPGPVVTLFEINPAPGVKVGQIVQLSKDLARSLVVASVRVVEVIPGKSYIGIEIPNNQREPVNFHEMLSSEQFQKQDKPLSMALGKDVGGSPVVIDLAKTPHLLVAGTTGSGKSVGINSMILSLLYKSLPNEVRMILIDPKMLELSVYEGIPHLITPVVTDMGESTAALKWAVAEMERRYKLMSLLGVRNIIGYNEKIEKADKDGLPLKDPMYKPKAIYSLEEAEEAPMLEKMPYIVVIIDEFADLIMVVGKQIEELIARIAQKARAAGIHLILATQRPSVNVITGLIKANIPTRLSFQVSTKIDSRTILDQGGAEQLLGLGDMLYSAPGQGVPLRAHGAFVSDEEVHQTVAWLKENHNPPTYIENLQDQAEQTNIELGLGEKSEGEDELFSQAWEVVFRTRKVSISRVQRELRIGYNRAARLIEEMEQQGLISSPDERGNRDILAGKTEDEI